MKLSLYLDIEPWMLSNNNWIFTAYQQPFQEKPLGATRYRLDLEISDPAKPDVVIEVEAKKED